jgi:hypothetical protein
MAVYAGVGSRRAPPEALATMARIAGLLAGDGWLLRSGGAAGADAAFEEGAARAGGLREVWIPEDGFRGRSVREPEVRLPAPEAAGVAAAFHPAWDRLGPRARALIARTSHVVLGADLRTPADVVVCWTPDGGGAGGTGQAIRVASGHGVPVLDLGAPRSRGRTAEELADAARALAAGRRPDGDARSPAPRSGLAERRRENWVLWPPNLFFTEPADPSSPRLLRASGRSLAESGLLALISSVPGLRVR